MLDCPRCGTRHDLRDEACPAITGDIARWGEDAATDPEGGAAFGLGPGVKVGEYTVLDKIGSGGMGEVYLAEQAVIARRVAIKVLKAPISADDSLVGRFRREAESVNRIAHPNIVDIFAFGELPGRRHYLVMEYLEGENLKDRIGRAPRIAGDELMTIFDPVLRALSAAHREQIVHRDLKPDNIFLVRSKHERTVKLLDFGIAKLIGHGVERSSTEQYLGTPAYMAPEQWDTARQVDARCDLYSLGVVLYEAVTGQLPFTSKELPGLMAAHMFSPPLPPSELASVPPQLEAIILACLAKRPDDRPQSADELLARLRAVGASAADSAPIELARTTPAGRTPLPPPQRLPSAPSDSGLRPARASRRPLALVATCLIAGAGFLAWQEGRRARAVSQPTAAPTPAAVALPSRVELEAPRVQPDVVAPAPSDPPAGQDVERTIERPTEPPIARGSRRHGGARRSSASPVESDPPLWENALPPPASAR